MCSILHWLGVDWCREPFLAVKDNKSNVSFILLELNPLWCLQSMQLNWSPTASVWWGRKRCQPALHFHCPAFVELAIAVWSNILQLTAGQNLSLICKDKFVIVAFVWTSSRATAIRLWELVNFGYATLFVCHYDQNSKFQRNTLTHSEIIDFSKIQNGDDRYLLKKIEMCSKKSHLPLT